MGKKAFHSLYVEVSVVSGRSLHDYFSFTQEEKLKRAEAERFRAESITARTKEMQDTLEDRSIFIEEQRKKQEVERYQLAQERY